jgi:hypothetical protein
MSWQYQVPRGRYVITSYIDGIKTERLCTPEESAALDANPFSLSGNSEVNSRPSALDIIERHKDPEYRESIKRSFGIDELSRRIEDLERQNASLNDEVNTIMQFQAIDRREFEVELAATLEREAALIAALVRISDDLKWSDESMSYDQALEALEANRKARE